MHGNSTRIRRQDLPRSRRVTKKKRPRKSARTRCDSNNGEKVVGTMGGREGSSRAAGTKMKSRRKGLVGALHRGIYEPGTYTRLVHATGLGSLEYDSLFNWSIEDVNARAD